MTDIKLTPLEFAAERNELETVRLLLKKGALPNPEREYETGIALMFSLMNDNFEMAKLLLEHGSGTLVRMTGPGPMDVLEGVCRRGHLEFVELFVRYGADVRGISKDHEPLKAAVSVNNVEAIKFLFNNGVEFNDPFIVSEMIKTAISDNSSGALELLIKEYSSKLNSKLDESFFQKIKYLEKKKIEDDKKSETDYIWWATTIC